MLVAGSSNSWTGLTAGNGSTDAVLFRSPTTQLVANLPYATAEATVNVDLAFVGLPDGPGPTASATTRTVLALAPGSALPVDPGTPWSMFSPSGALLARGSGPTSTPDFAGLWRLESGAYPHESSRWIWVMD